MKDLYPHIINTQYLNSFAHATAPYTPPHTPIIYDARTCRLRFSSSITTLQCRDSLRDILSTIESMQLMHRSYCEVKHPPAKHSPAGRHTRHNVQTQRRYLQISIPGHSIFWKSIHFSKSIHHASRHNASISTELAMDNLVEV